MLKRRIFYKGLSVCCGGPQSEVKDPRKTSTINKPPYDSKWLYAAEKGAQIDRKLEYPPIAIV